MYLMPHLMKYFHVSTLLPIASCIKTVELLKTSESKIGHFHFHIFSWDKLMRKSNSSFFLRVD